MLLLALLIAFVITLFCTGFTEVVLRELSTITLPPPPPPPTGIFTLTAPDPSYVAVTAPEKVNAYGFANLVGIVGFPDKSE